MTIEYSNEFMKWKDIELQLAGGGGGGQDQNVCVDSVGADMNDVGECRGERRHQ